MKKSIKTLAVLALLPFLLFFSLILLASDCKTERVSPDCAFLRQKYANKADYFVLSRQEGLEAILENRVLKASRNDLKGNNGYSCGDFAYVADDLPSAASRYVSIHEALHLSGVSDEAETNWKAARLVPWGMIETVIYTFYSGYREASFSDWPCVSKKMWENFKTYFI